MTDYWDWFPTALDRPPDWDVVPPEHVDQALFAWLEHAIDHCDLGTVAEILRRRPGWMNSVQKPFDPQIETYPLESAVIAECPEIVAWLLDHGADPICENMPLWEVAMKLRQTHVSVGYTAVLRIGQLLLDRGASPDVRCVPYGRSPQEAFFSVANQDLATFIRSHQ